MKPYQPKYKLQENSAAVLSDAAFDDIASRIEKIKPDSAEGEKVLDVIDTFKSAEKMGATKRAWEFIKKHLNETYVAKLLKHEMDRIEASDYKQEFKHFSNDRAGNVSVISEFISLALQALTYHAMEEKTQYQSPFTRKLLGEAVEAWTPLSDVDIRMAVGHGVKLAFDDIEAAGKKSQDAQGIIEVLMEATSVDETSVIDIPMNKKLDLCMYYEDETQSGVPQTSWSQLSQVIATTAAAAMEMLVRSEVSKAAEKFDENVQKFGLDWSKVSTSSILERLPHESEEEVGDDVYVMHYIKPDGGSNIDLYEMHFDDNGANIKVYFTKTA
jgi:hypothetical protein